MTKLPDYQVYTLITQAIGEYESTAEINQFSSKYDAYLAGTYTMTASELNGLRLVTGSVTGRPGGPPFTKNAQCTACHAIPVDPNTGPDLWSAYCFANIGVPRNPRNPYYQQTDPTFNPTGYNPYGTAFVDLGLGDFLYPQMGFPQGNNGPGPNGQGPFTNDTLAINGTFKNPTLRNVDKRPPGFVKSYMHNGVFLSLKTVVHFYNTRNLTTQPGEVIDFTLPTPYANLVGTPLWQPPEIPSPVSLTNPAGTPASQGGQVGNLGLTDSEENDIVAFLQTLTDGYTTPISVATLAAQPQIKAFRARNAAGKLKPQGKKKATLLKKSQGMKSTPRNTAK